MIFVTDQDTSNGRTTIIGEQRLVIRSSLRTEKYCLVHQLFSWAGIFYSRSSCLTSGRAFFLNLRLENYGLDGAGGREILLRECYVIGGHPTQDPAFMLEWISNSKVILPVYPPLLPFLMTSILASLPNGFKP